MSLFEWMPNQPPVLILMVRLQYIQETIQPQIPLHLHIMASCLIKKLLRNNWAPIQSVCNYQSTCPLTIWIRSSGKPVTRLYNGSVNNPDGRYDVNSLEWPVPPRNKAYVSHEMATSRTTAAASNLSVLVRASLFVAFTYSSKIGPVECTDLQENVL